MAIWLASVKRLEMVFFSQIFIGCFLVVAAYNIVSYLVNSVLALKIRYICVNLALRADFFEMLCLGAGVKHFSVSWFFHTTNFLIASLSFMISSLKLLLHTWLSVFVALFAAAQATPLRVMLCNYYGAACYLMHISTALAFA